MWTDAILAYLHFTAIFILFAFLTAETMLIRGALDANAIRLLGRMDLWYFGSAIAAARSTTTPTGRSPTPSAAPPAASS